MTKDNKINASKAARHFLSQIGKKGGHAGKGSPAVIAKMRRATALRLAKAKAKPDLYQAIAAKYTPPGVIAVPVAKHHAKDFLGVAHVEEEYDDEGNELPFRKMEVPVPNTIGRLFTYLHETVHTRLRHRALAGDSETFVRNEEEAD